MSHTTYGYTREKLGFEPDREERRLTHYAGVQSSYTNGNGQHTNGHNGHSQVDTMTGGVYEENLSKFKDERDAIQKKTFTKWVNKHLKKAGRNVRDLFEDLRDGHNLLSLLEVLSGEILPRERGRMRFHAIQNVETALRFLRYKEIKLVNIRGEDIVDGNPKLTLGLIWTIILHFQAGIAAKHHAQISDIVVGQEDLTAKEALLRWAQKTTHKYPGVEVRDFTQSWRDGLALNAIIHRNRPDLLDWRQVEKREVRERIDLAFHVMDREYGVTRLLDPEDVDTPEPDEKSIITYVSQLYDVFPEPPPGHPLFDAEAAKKFDQFKELASSLHQWIREHTTIMQDRNFPNTLIEMKRLSEESNRFRVEDIPPRLHEKEKLFAVFRDIERQMKDANFELDRDLYPDNIERSWSQLMMLFQERDTMIHEEIARLEKLQRLAEKIHQEAKMTDSKLDDIEAWIEDEAKRIDHLHPKDAKNNCEQIERELARTEETIKSMFSDVQILRDNRFSQSQDLHRRVQQVHEKWVNIRTLLQTKLINILSIHTNPDFKFLAECTEWVAKKLTQLKESEYGTDMQTVKVEYDRHQKEHKVIDQFQGNVEKCREAEVKFHGEELKIYGERMTILQKAYNELLVLSNKRVSDLHSLYDFMQAAHAELTWLNDREDKESGRDWSDKNLKLTEVEQYYEKLMSELEKRETQFSSVMDRGESLIIGHHSASQVIEAHMLAMQNKWAWLLQLTLCLETHLKHTGTSHRFFHECSVAEEFMTQKEEILNNHFAQADFKLEDGENLLKEMQQLREELAGYEDEVQRLIEASGDIVPLRQRRERLRNPVEAIAICKYSSTTISINRDEVVTVKDNTNQKAWKFTTSRGQAGEAPGVMFLLPPPDQEAVDTAEKLKRHYDRVITLWQKKHLRMRQNMIFATIKVVKSWDFEQYLSMDKETRTNIRRALNEDAEKLIQEGEQNDPQLRRLEREIAEVNRLFDEWERRALMEDEKRNALKLFTDMCNTLEMTLSEYEKTIIKVCKAPLPRDVESLQTLVISHKEFESDLQSQEPTVNNVKSLFNNIPQKTPKDQAKLDKVLDQWDRIWSYSSYYVERLKTVEITLTGLEEVTTVVTEFEMKLASYDSMPSDMDNLRKAHDDLMTLEADIQDKQGLIDQLQEDVKHVRPSVEKTRPNVAKNPDVDRLEEDVNRMSKRWGNCCMQVVERLRSCEAACELLEKYNMSYQTETNWMDELDSKLRNLEELEEARAKEAWEKHVQCFDEARERAPHVEQVNTLGGRYVREAKIYDLRLERFQCDLEEVHPSLDGSIKKRNKQSGADTVSQELDLFNLKYQRLCESLRSRLEEVGDESKDDPEIQSKLTNLLLAPLAVVRTFREFIGTDLESASQNRVIEEEVITKATNSTETENQIENQESQENQKSVALVTITNKESSPVKTNVVVAKNGDSSLNGDSTDSHSVDTGNTLTFNEIRTGKRIELASAGISTDLSVGAGGIVDPITGQPLSLDEAIRCGLVDTSTGEFVDPKTGRRYSLGEAVSKGLIDPQLAETLSSNCGIFDPKSGRHISLLEAIDKGLFDPKEKSFVDPKTGKPVTVNDAVKLGFILQEKVSELFDTMGPPKQSDRLTLIDAIRHGFVDVNTGKFKDKKGTNVSLSRAITSGQIDIEPVSSSGLSLSDAIRQNIVQKGKVIDRNTGYSFNLSEAVERGLINPDKNEVYDEKSGNKISLKNALESNIINSDGSYNGKNSVLSLEQAVKSNRIQNPMTLKECCDQQLVDDNNAFKNAITNENCSLLSAVGVGFVDYELKSVRDVKNEVYISLGEALGKGIMKPDGSFLDTLTNESMALSDAVKKGFLTSVSQKSIFEIEGIKNPITGDYVSFNEALEHGIIDKSNCTFLDKKTMTRMILQEAADKDFIQPQLLEMLERPIGITVLGNELTLIQAVMNKRLDPMSGLLIDTNKSTVPLEIAVEKKLITSMGAAILKSLLNITVTTATVTQTVRRTIKVSSIGEGDEGIITFQDALRRGLIDENTGIFTDPETGKEIALDEAINLGMIKLGQSSATSTRKSSTTSMRKTSNTSTASSRKSSNASSRSSSPPKSLSSAKEFLKESSSRDTRSASLTTSIKMSSSATESRNASTTSSRHGSVSSRRESQASSKSVSAEKKPSRPASQASDKIGSRPVSRTSTQSGLNGSRPGSPQKSKSTANSPLRSPEKSLNGHGKKLDRLDSFEARMEERSEIESFSAESKMDYSYKSDGTKIIPIKCESRSPSPPKSRYDVPSEGFLLNVAIDEGLFDPTTGLFKIPGTDRETSFKECIELNLINAYSATVYQQERKYSLKKAVENRILDATGHYSHEGELLSMKEALDLGFLNCESFREVEIQHQASFSTQSHSSTSHQSIENVSENILFDKSSGTYEVKPEMKPIELMAALKDGKILPSDIKVDDPSTGTKINIMEAMSKGLISRSTGEYTGGSKKMNILEALKIGAVALVGAPIALAAAPIIGGKMAYDKITSGRNVSRDELEHEVMSVEKDTMKGGTIHARIVESGVTTTRISSFTVEVPGTGEEISLDEAVKRGLVSEETAKQYREEVTTDKTVESMMVLIIDPSTGEEIPSDEAVSRGIVTHEEVEEFIRMKEDKSKLSTYGSVASLNTYNQSREGSPIRAVSPTISLCSSRMTQQTDRDAAVSRMTTISSSSESRASSADSSIGEDDKSSASKYSSTLTVDINKKDVQEDSFQSVREVESSTHTVKTKIVNLKQGYALSNLEEVRNLQTGETMSIYEAKLRGIATDIQGNKEATVTKQVKIFVSEAISRNLINFSSGVFTNPVSGQTVSIADAVKSGLLITDFKELTEETYLDLDGDKISAGDAFVHLFDLEQKTFLRKTHNRSYTLKEAVEEDWINGDDIIFDVSSSTHMSVREAMEQNILNGITCQYTVTETKETMFIGEAAKKGLIALFPEAAFEVKKPKYSGRVYSLREAIDEGIYQIDTGLFFVIQTEEHITISEALRIGMIDANSAEVKNTSKGTFFNLTISVQTKILHHTTCKVLDVTQHTELNLLEAYERGLLRDVLKEIEKPLSPFDGINFWDAIENGQLNTETGLFFSTHEEGNGLKLEEAIFRKYICKKSAFIIDTWKRKFCSLSEATRKNIIKDGLVMNTTSGKYMRLKEAIEQKIVVRDVTKLTLIEILDFGLYQPYSGKMFVPGNDIEMTLSEAIDSHIIDHTKTIVKNQKSGRFISTLEALHLGDIDGVTGMYGNMNLLEARSRGYLLPIDAMQAVQEKFRQASENLDDLNKWLDRVERDIASQEVPYEDVDGLKNQINALKQIKDDVDEHNRPVNNTLDIIAELVETGADVLSSAELNKLQADGKQLKTRYDNVSNNSDRLLKRMVGALEELSKFRGEVSAFRNWMEKAYKVLEDKERQLANLNKVQGNTSDIKDFVSDVMTHGADLKFLTISGQKFVDLSKDYVGCLNEFRMALRQTNLKLSESQVSEEVGHVSTAYHELLARANSLADRLSNVGGKYKDYNDAVERAKKWLKETEPKVAKICNEPVAAEPRVVEDQLNRAKALNNEIIANGQLIDAAKQAAANLLASLDNSSMSKEERRAIENTPIELQQRYDALRVMMAERCADLDSALVACQGVQDALANIAAWLDGTDKQLEQIMKPASLMRERLDEQMRQLKVLQSDVISHEPSIHKMYESAQQFIQNSSNVRETKKIETKVKEVQKKFEVLVKTVQTREMFFNEISTTLQVFTSQVENFEVWYLETIDILESRELLQMDADESAQKIDELVKRKEQMKAQFDEMIKNGKGLVNKKDTTDKGPCTETIRELEEKWKELGDILGERQASNRLRKQSLNAYEALREQVYMWLSKMEQRVEELEPLAVDIDMLNKQMNDLKPLTQEYTGYSKTIDKVNELGMQYDNVLRGSIDNGSPSRRSSVSPRKPSLTPSLLSSGPRRPSASPKFGGSPGSPIRRESGIPMFQEASPIQTQLSEINNRYDMIGIRLGDRDRELANMREEVKKYLDMLKGLAQFIEKQERAFPQESIPTDKKEADKQLRVLKGILDQLYEHQGQLDTAKVNIKDLLKKKPDAPGAEILDDTLTEITVRWKDLQEKCKERANLLDELKDFHDIHDNLNNWLNSKGKLMNILGPIASDPRLVQNQMSQIQVMKEEFVEKQPNKERFNDIGETILDTAGSSPDGRKVEDKLDNINRKWDDLLNQLEERERALEAVSGPTRDFLNLSNKLSDNLSKISDDLDDIAVSKADAEQKLKTLTGVAQNLDNQRPLFSEVMAIGDQLMEILTDPASKSEIKGKMGQVERQFNNCQKKLDNAMAELENSAKEGREFEAQCAAAQDWLQEMEALLSEKLAVSADRNTLMDQVADFEPIYKEVMSKEHEIIMVLNRGKDVMTRSSKADASNIKKNLDIVEKSWQKVRKIAQERQTRLNTCMEYCKKFYGAQDKFLPWLEKAESQISKMESISMVLSELKKQEKELQTFRNDVNRHGSEFDSNYSGGDSFQASCDTDKEIVKEEIGHMKERWDNLNYFISERAQTLADILAKLGDFNENARDLENGLKRAEEKLKNTDNSPKDPRLLDKIKGLLDEAKDLEKGFGKVQKGGEDLLNDADAIGADGQPIADTVNSLGDRLGNLRDRLEDKAEDLKNAGAAVGEFNEKAKDLGNALAMLDDELNKMGPIARDLNTLYKQKDEVQSFLQRISKKHSEVATILEDSKQLINSGVVPNPRELQDTVAGLQKSVDKLEQRGASRDKDVDDMIVKVQTFYDHYGSVMDDIQEVIREEKNLGAIAGDTESIKSQQEEFKQFQVKVVNAVSKEVEKSNRSGQGLIQSAASGVNTGVMEKDLEAMNDLWNSLKQALAERERKLDQGLLQSGKYGEALGGLMSWMDEMEDMMQNQKPPSADYKVVKAQVQEQKFVQKLLNDRKGAVASLVKTGQEIAASADPSEKRRIEGEVQALQDRYGSLNQKCADRMDLLEDAMKMAKEYADKLGPLEKWLDKTEKKIKEMETVPTEEDQIQRRIREHEKVHDDIIGKQPTFDDLADVASALMQVVGDEDAQALADKIEELTNRYAALVTNSDNIAQLLQDSMAGLRNLVMAYEDLLGWMEECETRLASYKILSVFSEKLMEQTEQLHDVTEEIVKRQPDVDNVVAIGNELMKHITNEESLSLKDKLDSLQRKYNDLASKAADLLKNAQDMLPLVQNFHQSHNRLSDWMNGVEGIIQSLDTYSLEEQEGEIHRLEGDIQEHRPLLEGINLTGPQLCQLSPGDGARAIEGLVTRDNRRFEAICEQVQRRGERIALAKQKSGEVLGDIDELLSWFREVEGQIREADPPSHEPEVIRVQLKEHKALNDDISSQKGRVRDVLSNAKKVLRESAQTADTEQVREKMDDLKETMETVISLSSERLGILEQALPLAEHFYETHGEINEWLDDIEREVMTQMNPGMRPDQIAKQQEIVRSLMQSVQDHKPVLDRLNKTGGALLRLIVEDDADRVQDIVETDNQRYNNLKADLREKMQALEDAMHDCSQFTDKLDGMLNSLEDTKDQLVRAEPISAHPEKIKEQIDDNNAIIDDLGKKEVAYEAVKRAAEDVIQKAPNKQDPAVKDIKKKLDKLCGLWNEVQGMAKNRGDNLEDALALAEKFWDELQQVMANLKELEQHLASQEPPAVEPKAIEAQKRELQEIKRGIDGTKPVVDKCRVSGSDLLSVVGEPEKPELKRHIEDLDNAWESITSMYAKREKNLLDAMEKAMEFHDMLNSLLEFLSRSEAKYDNMGAIGTDIATVKKQIDELKKFKDEVDPWMVKVEALNRQADDLTERTSPDQARAIKEPLAEVNKRWTDLNKAIVIRQKELEHALLRLGQFQHALSELLVWIERTDKTLDTLKPVYGDPQVIEVELAKLKVIVNDIQAHQSSVDTLNDAGRQIIETEKGSREASQTQQKLNELNSKWNALLGKGEDRQAELEDALREAQAFNQEVQDMLMWLNDVDTALSTSKPVGGLPETAKDQLDRFMEVYHDLEATGPKIEALLGRGNDYLKKSKDGQATNLSNNLKTLKARWDNIINRANDKKIKLEIALKEALEFHEALQSFIDWLTNAEKTLGNLKPVSRVMETILMQIEEHKEFQAEVSSQRETMLSLDKKGTHLKYFSQKQDVILIKNLLVSVQHRWEKVVSKSAERTRALDYGYKEAKEFHDAWDFMMGWLDDGMIRLDEMSKEVKNDPEKIKQQIMRHKEFQKELGEKQPMYDSTMKTGKGLIGKAPKTDEPTIKNMMTELKNKWNNLCNLSVERQRKLEEALLFSGQFKDALKALMDWLANMEKALDDKQPVHGDLDTVIGLVEQHKNFEEELNSRTEQVEQLKQTAEELLRTAESEDAIKIRSQVTELTNRWENVWDLSKNKTKRLEDALKQAEELHKFVSMLLEWLSDAEMKLRFAGPLPEDEEEVNRQLAEHAKFMMELKEKEKDKDYTIDLAQEILKKCHPDAVQVIKHWITIIQSRWDEVASWALQRQDKLEDHLRQLQELLALLDELMQWLIGKEHVLTTLEQEPLPDDLEIIRELIVEHQGFMDGLTERQPEIDNVCKPMRPKSTAPSSRRTSKAKGPGRDSREGSADIDPSRRPSQYDPDREGSPSKSRKSSFYGDGYRDGVSPSRDYPKPWLDFLYMQSGYPDRNGMGPGSRRTSRASPGDRATPDRRGGPRFPDRKGSRASVSQGEGGIKNPRAKALWDKWRHVWMMAWERDRRLKDKLNYLQELEKVKNFNWEEWRKRYLKHHNNKKSRVQDFFRKLDDDGDGYCPRDEFIDGILKAKFPSSKLEMNAVADKFDHGDGMIDWREFMVALRPDWEERGPLTDTQRIDDEIKRQVAQCTCRQKFKVFQVGEGKYRFGDSQKLRLVRILRSTVMVRVGGGWCALDEFLVKNDPCRAKGRTNVELREQFTLASGVSQSMTPFKSKAPPAQASPTSSVSGETRNGMQGPITKIKEKSERSLGMNVRSSVDYGYQDETSSFSRRTSTQGRNSLTPGSQPGSRPGSRPPSRHGSNMSLNSDDEGRRGSGVRRTSSMRSGARGLRPTPVGFGSGVPRKTSTPGDRKRTDSNSSTDRTPLSARMRSKSYITPRPSKMIKSTSESNIPVFVGCHSTNTSTTSTPNRTNNSRPNSRNTSISGPPGLLKARQPSSSNIPVPTNNRTRTPSGSGPRGSLQRSGSNMGQKATAYSADGSKFGSSNALRNAVNTQRDWQ